MKLFVLMVMCLFALAGARRTTGGRQLRRNDGPTDLKEAFWDNEASADSTELAARQLEGRQYYQPQGGYGGSWQQGGGGYPGQGGSTGGTGGSGSGGSGGSGGSAGSGGSGGSAGSGGSGGSAGTGGSGASGGDGTGNEIPSPPQGPNKPGKPQRPKGCLADRGQFPSPKSCAHYLNCWDDVVIEQQCPTGLLFNEKKQYCDFDYNVQCGNRQKPSKPSAPGGGNKRCPEPNGRYRSATNCSEFYVCVNGNPIKFNCPEGLGYNDELQICDYPWKVDCKGAATPKPLPTSTETPSSGGSGGSGGIGGNGGESNPNPNPPYNPDQPELPGPLNPYGNNAFAFRGRPTEFWQQRKAVLQSELEKDLQSQKEPEQNDEEELDSSTIANPWEVISTIPQEFAKVPCENGEVHRLTESCTSVVVCRSHRPQLINCQTGYAYDKPSDSCRPYNIARC